MSNVYMVLMDSLSEPYDVLAASEPNRLLACNRVFEYRFKLRSSGVAILAS